MIRAVKTQTEAKSWLWGQSEREMPSRLGGVVRVGLVQKAHWGTDQRR